MSRPQHERGVLLVLLVALGYACVHVGFRIWASSVLGEDDVYDNLLAQDLRLGYEIRQPPLYDWVLWAVQQVTGPTLWSFLLVKYAALTATAGFLYLAAVRILGSRLWAFLTVESLALIYQIAWRYHEGFTHQVLAMVAVAATLWALLRIIDGQRLSDFALLGVIAGLGGLTEPSYSVYLVCLLAAAALQPGLRRRVLRPGLLLSLVVALLIAAPFLWWLLGDPRHLRQLTRAANASGAQVLRGMIDAARGPVLYLSPLIFFMPFVFPGFLKIAGGDLLRRPSRAPDGDLSQLVLHGALIAVLASLGGAVALGIGGYAIHALMPLYVSSVVWLFSVAMRAHGAELGTRRFARLAAAIAVLALLARIANMFVLDPVCKTCRWGVPYAALAEDLRKHGLGRGVIATFEHPVGGNLRALLPESTFVSRRYPHFTPRSFDPAQRPLALVWSDEFDLAYAKRFLDELLPAGRSLEEARRVVVPWRHLWKPEGYRTSVWNVLIIE